MRERRRGDVIVTNIIKMQNFRARLLLACSLNLIVAPPPLMYIVVATS